MEAMGIEPNTRCLQNSVAYLGTCAPFSGDDGTWTRNLRIDNPLLYLIELQHRFLMNSE